jgi:hypothetical protein
MDWVRPGPRALRSPAADDVAEDEGAFESAYEGVTYRDTARDGIEGSLLEGASLTDDEQERQLRQTSDHLRFHCALARLWSLAAAARTTGAPGGPGEEHVAQWLRTASEVRRQLLDVAITVQGMELPPPSPTRESLLEYDRRRTARDTLVERVVYTCVELTLTMMVLAASASDEEPPELEQIPRSLVNIWKSILVGDIEQTRGHWPAAREALRKLPLLYSSLPRRGDPRAAVTVRARQRILRAMAQWLPRLGLMAETFELLRTALYMEQRHPAGTGAITEFDRMFDAAGRSIFGAITNAQASGEAGASAAETMECLERWKEALLAPWLSHSRGLRLSSLEPVAQSTAWSQLVEFIEKYGGDLFEQSFFHPSNLRAIRHQGVGNWLSKLEELSEESQQILLLSDLDRGISRRAAERHLEIIVDATIEMYEYYRDYNTTTTQSDHGNLFYMLLDFLRLLGSYERVEWNLRPARLAHEALVISGLEDLAEEWRQSVRSATSELADRHRTKYARLCQQYGMRLESVRGRLDEQFIQPLVVDRIRALIRRSLGECPTRAADETFQILEGHANELLQDSSGCGPESPRWLSVLEDEMDNVLSHGELGDLPFPLELIPVRVVTREQIMAPVCDSEPT